MKLSVLAASTLFFTLAHSAPVITDPVIGPSDRHIIRHSHKVNCLSCFCGHKAIERARHACPTDRDLVLCPPSIPTRVCYRCACYPRVPVSPSPPMMKPRPEDNLDETDGMMMATPDADDDMDSMASKPMPAMKPHPMAMTKKPHPTMMPKATKKPYPTMMSMPTKKPHPTMMTKATKKPHPTMMSMPTKKPHPTMMSKATKKPHPTTMSKATKKPHPTMMPKATKKPYPTMMSMPTKKPHPTMMSKATKKPHPTMMSMPTEKPHPTMMSATKKPYPTTMSKATKKPHPTVMTEASKKPHPTMMSKPTMKPHPTNQTRAQTPKPSQKACASFQRGGGGGNSMFDVDLLEDHGSFMISWQMDTVPDMIEIFYENKKIFTTEVPVSGHGSAFAEYSGKSTKIRVWVTSPTSGTGWFLTIGCVKDDH